MKAKESIKVLNPEKWAKVSARQKLKFLKLIRDNLEKYGEELGKADQKMKNDLIGQNAISFEEAYGVTVFPVGGTVSACIDLYESIIKGKILSPISVKDVGKGYYDVKVFPRSRKDKIFYADRKDFLRIKGKPKQVHPLKKKGGIIGILGAGNYSSSIEMITALFLENSAVVHKPHHLNEATDKIWEKVMKPLIDFGALSFCDADQGRDLVKDKRLSKIYFTGGTPAAKAIQASASAELVSECGGNNPCILIPGDKPWTKKEIEHQTMQIATLSKMNGGAVCGRIQTIVTCKNWSQRDEFLEELKKALRDNTPAGASHYPGTNETMKKFKKAHPKAKVLKPEHGKVKNSDFLLIEGASVDSYAVKNEAFCQILSEVPLDTPKNVESFLPEAVKFCNDKLLGTLGSCIFVDNETLKNHKRVIEKATGDMKYGTVGVNTQPPAAWMNPYTIWAGNEEGKELISGRGNFGNILNLENVEKSIIYSDFMSNGHFLTRNRTSNDKLLVKMTKYMVRPTWGKLMGLIFTAMTSSKRRDF